MWKVYWKAQFPHSFGRFAWIYAETVPFHKITHQEIRWNYGILRSVNVSARCQLITFVVPANTYSFKVLHIWLSFADWLISFFPLVSRSISVLQSTYCALSYQNSDPRTLVKSKRLSKSSYNYFFSISNQLIGFDIMETFIWYIRKIFSVRVRIRG